MYLGLDLGTSELKALLCDEHHRIHGIARAPLTAQRPQALWSEQDPQHWIDACERVMLALAAEHPQAMAQVRAMGLSGQMHGAVLMDKTGKVLRPALLWNDGRSAAQCDHLTRAVPTLSAITGNLAMPGFTAPKVQWVREHEPQVFAQTSLILLPKDYLRWHLSGEAVSDMSDASGTLWLDVGARVWSDTMLAACDLGVSHMPRLVEGSALAAQLKPALAARWGLPRNVVIAGGGGDNAASAVGMGCVAPGQGFVSLGTSGVIFVAGATFAPNPAKALHAFCHALPQRWHQMSVMLSAASALTWAARILGLADEATLLQQAESLGEAQRESAPVFLPYLSGERSPHNNPNLQATWHGMTHDHQTADLAYAVVEGVSLGLRDGWDSFGATPPAQQLSAVGGGARSRWWLQQLASTLNVSIVQHEGGEAGGALGAARLAWLADGGDEAQVCRAPPVAGVLPPQAKDVGQLARRQQRKKAVLHATAQHATAHLSRH